MPYPHISDLPEFVLNHRPHRAQEIYLKAIKHAWDEYNHNGGSAHRVAWAAVKNKSVKNALTSKWESK